MHAPIEMNGNAYKKHPQCVFGAFCESRIQASQMHDCGQHAQAGPAAQQQGCSFSLRRTPASS